MDGWGRKIEEELRHQGQRKCGGRADLSSADQIGFELVRIRMNVYLAWSASYPPGGGGHLYFN
jgi:hypothetical protein